MNTNFLTPNGIFSDGYGFVPKMMMRDKRLSVEAKAIYSYLSSFAGAGMTAFPSVELMLSELNISEDRFYKHRKILIELGYVSIEQKKGKGKFAKNIYVINTCAPHPHFTGTEKPSTENACTGNKGANSNSLNINTSTTNGDESGEDKNPPKPPKEEKQDYQSIVDEWNKTDFKNIKAIAKGSPREKLLIARIKDYGVDAIIEAIVIANQSDFLKGRNDKGWVMDFTWFIKPVNFLKVYENNYANRVQGVPHEGNSNRKLSAVERVRLANERARAEREAQNASIRRNMGVYDADVRVIVD